MYLKSPALAASPHTHAHTAATYFSRASSYSFKLALIASLSGMRRASWICLVYLRRVSMCLFVRMSNFLYASCSRDVGCSRGQTSVAAMDVTW